MIKRPCLCLFAAFCLGIVSRGNVTFVRLAVFITYCFILLLLKTRPGFERLILRQSIFLVFLPLMILLGASDAEYKSRDYDCDLTLLQESGRKAEGYVYGSVEKIEKSKSGYKLTLKKVELRLEGAVFTQGRLLMYVDEADEIKIGNRLEAIGSVRELAEAENPGQFDEKAYYRAKGLSCKFYSENYAITDDKVDFIREKCRRIRERLADVYDRLFPSDEAGTVKAIVLGDKSSLSEDTREIYQKTGIGHILAISGLHVSMVGNTLFVLLRACKTPLLSAALWTALALMGYGFITDFSVSTIRAVFMLLLSLTAKILGKSYDSCEACSLCGLGLLIWQPLWLFQTGFQLSFAAAIGIALFRIEFNKWKAGEGFGIRTKLVKAVLSGTAPQLVTTPIILSSYYEIPTFSLLINLLLLPFMGLLLALSILCGALGLVFFKGARFLSGGPFYILQLYRVICETINKVPGSMILFGSPGRLRLLLCYGLLIAFFVLANHLGYKHRLDGRGAKYRQKAAWLLLVVPFIFIKLPYDSLGLTHLSVGQGDSAILQLTNNTAIMIDCGSSSVTGLYKYRLEPFLKYSGIDTLEAVFISHPDKDHISGIQEMLEDIDNSGLYHGSVRLKRLVTTPASLKSGKLDVLISLAEEKNVELVTVLEGDVAYYNDLKLTCLGPSALTDKADNDGSMILLAQYYDFDAIFMGDSAGPGEAAVLAADRAGLINYPAELLKIAHHGSKNASSEEFIRTIKPKIAVLSYGRGNNYGHPHFRVLSLLEDLNSIIYKTGQGGAACFKIHKNYK